MSTNAVIAVDAKQVEGTLAEVRSGRHTWHIDEPAAFGGEDRAPSPVQALLGALAGCLVAAGCQIAREWNLPFAHLECSISGHICPDRFFGKEGGQRAGFHHMTVSFHGLAAWTPAQRTLWTEQVLKRCPVLDNLLQGTPIQTLWRDAHEGMDLSLGQDR